MAQYYEKIGKLAEAAGCSANPFSKISQTILENEISNLANENQWKQLALQMLSDQHERIQTELKVQKEYSDRFDEEIKDEADKILQKLNILNHYFETIEKTDEFLPNKLRGDIEKYNENFSLNLRTIYQKAVQIVANKEKMLNLKRQCDELKQRVGQ